MLLARLTLRFLLLAGLLVFLFFLFFLFLSVLTFLGRLLRFCLGLLLGCRQHLLRQREVVLRIFVIRSA